MNENKKKVLHIAHRLPDIRVEKMMLAGLDLGYEVEIVTEEFKGFSFEQLSDIIIHYYKSSFMDQIGFSNSARNTLISIISSIQPDVIHAHDIYNAHFISATDETYIYDDHDFWSHTIKLDLATGVLFSLKRLRRIIGLYFRKKRIPKWEKDIIKNNVTVTVSDNIATHHKQFSDNIYVIENLPHSKELISNKVEARNPKKCAYIGRDIGIVGSSYRNTTGFLEALKKNNEVTLKIIGDALIQSQHNIESTGYIPHKKILSNLLDCSYGIIAWYPNELQHYFNPNKLYLYAHAGLFVGIPNTLPAQGLKFYTTFSDWDELMEIINTPREIDHAEIIKHAREFLVFDNRYNILDLAYQNVMNMNRE